MNDSATDEKSISISRKASPKMKDVAERAGVSLMTVSLALRSDDKMERISPETRARVQEAARELRYSPNTRAQRLRSGVTNVIGLYAGYGRANVRLPFFTEVVSGLQEGCEIHRKDLLLHSSFGNRSVNEIYNELRDGRIDGLIVTMPPNDPLADLLAQAHFPVVSVGDSTPGISAVTVDDGSGSQLLVQHLFARGHRTYLYAASHLEGSSRLRRRQAFTRVAAEVGLSGEEFFLYKAADVGEEIMQHWLSLAPLQRPTAIVCWNDLVAYAVVASCRRHGIRVPDDVAIVGFDGCPVPYDNFLRISTIRAPWAQVAQLAMEHLNALIRGDSVPLETVLPVELVIGNTT